MDVSRGLRNEIREDVLLIDAEVHQEDNTEEPIEEITTKHESNEQENEKIAMVTTLKPIEAIVPVEKDDKYDYEDEDVENDAEDDDEDVAEDKDDAEAKDEDDYEEQDGNVYEDDKNVPEDDDEDVAEDEDGAVGDDEEDCEEEDGNQYEDEKKVAKDDDAEDEEDAVGDDEDDDERKSRDKYEDDELPPIRYRSKKTTETEKKNSSYESEVQAIVDALKKFLVYLLRSKFKVVTDCSAFQKTMEKKDLATRIERWTTLLEEERRRSRSWEKEREELRHKAENQIQKAQGKKGRAYKSRRRKPQVYDLDDVVAERRTQFDPGAKLKSKFLGSDRIVCQGKAKGHLRCFQEGVARGSSPHQQMFRIFKEMDELRTFDRGDRIAGRPSCGICYWFGARV